MIRRGAYKPRKPFKAPASLGQRIQALRRSIQLTQEAFASLLGVPQQSISSWERDLSQPSGPVMMALSRCFGINEHALLTGEGFCIPESSVCLSQSQSSDCPGFLMAHSKDAPTRIIPLPPCEKGAAWGINLADGEQVQMSPEEAISWLQKIESQGDSVWIIAKPVSK